MPTHVGVATALTVVFVTNLSQVPRRRIRPNHCHSRLYLFRRDFVFVDRRRSSQPIDPRSINFKGISNIDTNLFTIQENYHDFRYSL